MTWVVTVVGAGLVVAALRDIFHTLWHPGGFGPICRMVFRGVWRASKPLSRRSGSSELPGPMGLLVTAGVWTALIVGGWTLVYLPHMPGAFYFDSSLQPGESSDLLASLYLSLVAVGTLGFGDIIPAAPALRVVVPLQALVGFVLLTAAISWVLQIYPALARRRQVALHIYVLARTDTDEVLLRGRPSVAAAILGSLAEDLMTVEMDLVLYGETYYFREGRPELSLAAMLPSVTDLITTGESASAIEVCHAAGVLRQSRDSLAASLDRMYLRTNGPVERVLASFAADHQQESLGVRS